MTPQLRVALNNKKLMNLEPLANGLLIHFQPWAKAQPA